jgi:hypothetical protein
VPPCLIKIFGNWPKKLIFIFFGLSDEITEAEIIWAGKVPTLNFNI